MAQIIRIPDGEGDFKWAIYDTSVEDFTHFFSIDDELIRFQCALAYEAERAHTAEIMRQLEVGGRPYMQFTLTWGEANERAYKHHSNEYEFLVDKTIQNVIEEGDDDDG